MATVVLTTVGGLIGGPLGAAIGGALGNGFDRELLFKPKGREGPRLQELRVQTSSYGTPIPKLFGTMRVAGSVIWATDLVEHRSTRSAKGQPSTTSYSYTASFAVALSTRPILRVGRIWAEGKLLRGAAGDFKVRTGFRLHPGGEDQPVDPLIAAAEGSGTAPAHRGIAYAVFENLELADFGNRIPALTFEVIADPGALEAGRIVRELCGDVIEGVDVTATLSGFSAYGDSARAVTETLAGAAGGWFRAEPHRLSLLAGDGDALVLDDAGAGNGAKGMRAIAAPDSAPRSVALRYYEPAREYQTGMQRATRPGAGTREAPLELAAAIDAGTAKTLAEAALARFDLERERRTLSLGWDALAVRPGERIRIRDVPGLWRVDRWSLEAMVVTLECLRIAPATLPAEASGGRVLPAPDVAIGATVVHAFELPPLDDMAATAPRLAVAAAGRGAGWRSAALLISGDGGATWSEAGATAMPALLGWVVHPPGRGPAELRDDINSIDIEMAHAGMLLSDADDAALDAGANLAMVGDELLQFGQARALGGATWRLSRLWRGRRGTEGAMGMQAMGDRFVLIQPPALRVLDVAIQAPGAAIRVVAQGVGDIDAATAAAAMTGISLVPPAPVHLAAMPLDDGGIRIEWTRRSRAGWRWSDGVDPPLVEEREQYRVLLTVKTGPNRQVDCDGPVLVLGAGEVADLDSIAVQQIGTFGASPSAYLQLSQAKDRE